MRITQIKADFNKRIARVEEQLKNIQGYSALSKALEVSSGAVYAVLGFDVDTLEGMEMLLHSLKTYDVHVYNQTHHAWLEEYAIIELLNIEQASRDFYDANITALEITMDRKVLRQYSKYIVLLKNFWESMGGTY